MQLALLINLYSDWLKHKSQDERKKLLEAARSLTVVHKADFTSEGKRLKHNILKLSKRRNKKLQRKEKRKLKKKKI